MILINLTIFLTLLWLVNENFAIPLKVQSHIRIKREDADELDDESIIDNSEDRSEDSVLLNGGHDHTDFGNLDDEIGAELGFDTHGNYAGGCNKHSSSSSEPEESRQNDDVEEAVKEAIEEGHRGGGSHNNYKITQNLHGSTGIVVINNKR
ncbi:hypothetical protein DdX_03751 [Ditylenchus destructor]|uniref:Uncharacterized protein n=1 Tax=Ditylenchus destructor TaxID=166010 RepID=A0AAD4NE89_9BILA|nr:hypothetical protein DdX_03751 [Ditylenchus destructor]